MDPSSHPLTYLSQKPVFQFLSTVPRKTLAKKCPEVRRWHRELPFRFEKVVLKYVDSNDDQVYILDQITIDCWNWEGRGLIDKISKYYLRRKGTRIRYFELGNFYPEELCWETLEDENISINFLVIYANLEQFRNRFKAIARKISFPVSGWRTLFRACKEIRNDRDGIYVIGTMKQAYLETMPYLEDYLDDLRNEFNVEFKYSDDGIGVCVEIPGNRELFIYYQLIYDKNLFTAEILEKGTTKHYHQLPMDQQEKFRDKEDDRNRVRVVKDYIYRGDNSKFSFSALFNSCF